MSDVDGRQTGASFALSARAFSRTLSTPQTASRNMPVKNGKAARQTLSVPRSARI